MRMRDMRKLRPIPLRRAKTAHSKGGKYKSFTVKIAVFAGVLLLGVVLGSTVPYTLEESRYLSYFVQQYLIENHGGSFAAVASGSFLSAMLLQVTVLFFSVSCIGAPVLLCILLLRGFSIGCIASFLYTQLGLRGLLANLALLWLPQVLQAIFLLFFVVAAWDGSVGLFRQHLAAQTTDTAKPNLSRCLRCFLFSSLGMLLAALAEGLLAAIFAPVLLQPLL